MSYIVRRPHTNTQSHTTDVTTANRGYSNMIGTTKRTHRTTLHNQTPNIYYTEWTDGCNQSISHLLYQHRQNNQSICTFTNTNYFYFMHFSLLRTNFVLPSTVSYYKNHIYMQRRNCRSQIKPKTKNVKMQIHENGFSLAALSWLYELNKIRLNI